MRRVNTKVVFSFFTILFLSATLPVALHAEDLDWQFSKQAAFELAEEQGKRVLLLAGRDS